MARSSSYTQFLTHISTLYTVTKKKKFDFIALNGMLFANEHDA